MSLLLIGANGNMGKRYSSILRFLGKDFVGVDVGHSAAYVNEQALRSDGILIATPTDTHAGLIRKFLKHGKPILCEKPVVKSMPEFRDLMSEIRDSKTPFRMVNQYRMLIDSRSLGKSHYNYFKHGNDGIYWDCLQIIGLARGEVKIEETSPVWRCKINGKTIHLGHMDAAYIAYLQHWFKHTNQDLEQIISAHEKTAELEKSSKDG